MASLAQWIKDMPGGRFVPLNVLETDPKVKLYVAQSDYSNDVPWLFRLFGAEYKPVEFTANEEDLFVVPLIVAELIAWYADSDENGWIAWTDAN